MWGIFKKTVVDRDDNAACDPDARSMSLMVLRYHLGFADHLLGGGSRESYGYCHVVPTLRGYDWIFGRWRQPMAFGGPTHALAACDLTSVEAHEMCSDADVVRLTPVYC